MKSESTAGTNQKAILPLSELLERILEEQPGGRLTLTQFSTLLGDRMWGGLLLTFAAINILPLPPGSTLITGIPLLLISAQLAVGRATPWFPKKADQRGLTKHVIRLILAKLLPLERRVERVFRPRMLSFTNHLGARIVGMICLLLSVILWLPIPLGNHAPAITMTIFALALLYRDGALVLLGGLATLVSLVLVSVTLGAAWLAITFALNNILPI
ncbi:exopolysaccharide biosynthesis protein [Sphingomonas piscis]|uniref:Exopolysaccharide biosynthesis protein n=1 Tax=Sphingomonas piscis TaxID=2714943 RepID=A0A6G7YMQ6_9SPHN|nr:exopolysaccharide biosynthesis protein [Sphingomonas piscis]QIK78035.1 exopolysaccharide biosynthesis protein [Sphingomonas piscis]